MCPPAKVPPLQALSGLCTSFPSRPNITKFYRDEEIRVNSRLCIHSSKLGMGGGGGVGVTEFMQRGWEWDGDIQRGMVASR